MKIMGRCTSVDLSDISFVLDGKITVFAALLNKVPAVGEVVRIANATWVRRKEIYLTDESVIHIEECSALAQDSVTHHNNGELITAITSKYTFDESDLDHLNKIANRLRQSNSFPLQEKLNGQTILHISVAEIVLKSVDHLLKSCGNNNNKMYSIKSPGDFREHLGGARPVRPWQFFNLKTDVNEHLIGYLHVSPRNGLVQVSDHNHSIPIIILCEQPAHLSRQLQLVIDKYVIIEKYYVLKEEYRNVESFPYVVVQVAYIHKLENAVVPAPEAGGSQFVDIHVRQRCSVTLNQGKASFLALCDLKSVHNEQSCFLRLERAQLRMHPLFNEQDVFKLQCSPPFIRRLKYGDKDMAYGVRTKNSIPCYILPCDSQLQYLGNKQLDTAIIWKSVSDVLSELTEQSDMTLLSFEGVIQSKRILLNVGKDPPNTRFRIKSFGLPREERGSYSYDIELKDYIDDQEPVKRKLTYEEQMAAYEAHENNDAPASIRVIIDHWTRKQCPLGLVPCMRVRLHNWIPVPNTTNCLKSTPTSSITPVDYYQETFNSANIEDPDWGAQWPLGDGAHVPIGTFCWGEIKSFVIRSLLLETKCDICFSMVEKGVCGKCGHEMMNAMHIWGKMVLIVKDGIGVSEVTTCELFVIQMLLDLDDSDWIEIAEAFKQLGHFYYNSFDDEDLESSCLRSSDFHAALLNHLKTIALLPVCQYDLKCRQIVNNRNCSGLKIKWYCIEARRTQTDLPRARPGNKITKSIFAEL